MKLTANKLKSLILEVLSEERDKLDVVIVGGFKPPHKGHYHFIKFYLDNPNVDKVVVISGDKEREGITFDDTKRILEPMVFMMIQNLSLGKQRHDRKSLEVLTQTLFSML